MPIQPHIIILIANSRIPSTTEPSSSIKHMLVIIRIFNPLKGPLAFFTPLNNILRLSMATQANIIALIVVILKLSSFHILFVYTKFVLTFLIFGPFFFTFTTIAGVSNVIIIISEIFLTTLTSKFFLSCTPIVIIRHIF